MSSFPKPESVSKQGVMIMTDLPTIDCTEFSQTAFQTQFKNSSLIIKAPSQKAFYESHWGALSIKCAFNGVENYKTKRCDYAVSSKNFLVLNRGSYRSSRILSSNPVESFTISFSYALESQVLSAIIRNHDSNLDDPLMTVDRLPAFTERLHYYDDSLLSKYLTNLYRNLDFYDEPEVVAYLANILEALVINQRIIGDEMRSMQYAKVSTKKEMYERLHRGKDFISSNYQHDLKLESIAAVACLNSFYFLREFKRFFGVTPHKYLQKLRVEEANRLLSTTSKSVTEVCIDVGFNDLSSFSKLYKRFYNRAPSCRG